MERDFGARWGDPPLLPRGGVPAFSRRALLGMAAAGAAGIMLSGRAGAATSAPVSSDRERQAWLSSASIRQPGSLPNPAVAPGTESIPEIRNIVMVMMENHSYDNILGMSGRGDGFPRGADGLPSIALPNGQGEVVHAFHMPSECMTNGVSQNWNVGHHSYDNGTNRGWVEAASGETMGYFLGTDVPFTWGLARTFPIADRWFCSAMCQTDPNRRYLFAGTSLGLIDDSFPTELPPNGTIFDSLNEYGITWKDYYSDAPTALVWIGLAGKASITDKFVKADEFFEDAAAGTLPQFSMLDPNYSIQSEENPQDIQYGDQYLSDVVKAVMSGPQWPHTLLIWTYDEWGGWYDHVVPPAAIPPDDVPPDLPPGYLPGGFDLYGFRVPAGVVSPYAVAQLRLPYRLRPHLGAENDRDQVEPPRVDPA